MFSVIMYLSQCVFPAPAGVIPVKIVTILLALSFPRTCGGDPGGRTRDYAVYQVFPAPAGVILYLPSFAVIYFRFPRTCGGDPTLHCRNGCDIMFSPHLRG